MKRFLIGWRFIGCLLFLLTSFSAPRAQTTMDSTLVPKFNLRKSGLELERRIQPGAFFDVLGRRAAVAGYENRSFEVWVYPLKIAEDFRLSFQLEGYPLDIEGSDTAATTTVRPEATIFTYSHAAFTVRQIIYAPIDEAGIIMLLDVRSALPLNIKVSFRPRLRLMWPGGLMTGYVRWDEEARLYYMTEETRRFVGILGSPAARDVSVMPYQEEPRDVPLSFTIAAPVETTKHRFIPIILAGSVEGRDKAKAVYDRLLADVRPLYEKNVASYEQFENETVSIVTPDERLNKAFAWAKIGVDKGMATNPLLGTGLLAGFRTSGESERPGFAWFFGRDALWTSLALNSYGDFAATRAALSFLKKFQREDGKIPHEISQSATLIPWFTDYPYAWASADATPLYVIAQADYWRASGDTEFLKSSWDSILRAFRFTAATDTDGNGLVENTRFGHGWVEGGALYPPHEEIYMQGLWIEAARSMEELATVMNDAQLATEAKGRADRTQTSMEQTYWLVDRGFYAFATMRPRAEKSPVAEPGPNRLRRQSRMNELAKATLIDEDTVLPAVPLWWRTLREERAQSEIDHLGGGSMATDWGARIISDRSHLYDPLSYHHGSVWPLFTGWASVGAYRYGRPHVGFQALWANAMLTFTGALGYVTELLSGDFLAPFGRSSHHQVWSEAMVVLPIMRGMLGLEVGAGGQTLRFAPQLPINWEKAQVSGVKAGQSLYDITLSCATARKTITITRRSPSGQDVSISPMRLTVAPAFPLDARLRSVKVNGRPSAFEIKSGGDVQRAEVVVDAARPHTEILFTFDEGTDVYVEPEQASPGAANQGLRVLRSRADRGALRLVLEGLGGRVYPLKVRTPHRLGSIDGVTMRSLKGADYQLLVKFDGSPETYTRREIVIPFLTSK